MIGGLAGLCCRCWCAAMGLGVSAGGAACLVTVVGPALCVGVGGRVMSAVGEVNAHDLTRLGIGGTACIGWQSNCSTGGAFLPEGRSSVVGVAAVGVWGLGFPRF